MKRTEEESWTFAWRKIQGPLNWRTKVEEVFVEKFRDIYSGHFPWGIFSKLKKGKNLKDTKKGREKGGRRKKEA